MKQENNSNEIIDTSEFVQLINQNKLKLYKTAIAILKNEDDAEDAIQEALMRGFNNKNQLQNKEYFVTWIITILRNKCFDIIKKKQRTVNVDETIIENTTKYYDTYKVESSLERVLNQLESDLRELTIYYYYDELSIKDISTIMNIPEGTVKSRLSRAREKIKNIIEMEEGDIK